MAFVVFADLLGTQIVPWVFLGAEIDSAIKTKNLTVANMIDFHVTFVVTVVRNLINGVHSVKMYSP